MNSSKYFDNNKYFFKLPIKHAVFSATKPHNTQHLLTSPEKMADDKDEDEWTHVPFKKIGNNKYNNGKKKKKKKNSIESVNLISDEDDYKNYKREDIVRQINECKQALLLQTQTLTQLTTKNEQKSDDDMSFYGRFEKNFSDILEKLKHRTNEHEQIRAENEDNDKEDRFVIDIVCYGIGNFYKAYSVPMLQLSSILLLRDYVITKQNYDSVNMYYYEPWMKPTEKLILVNDLDITIIDGNERGKRSAELNRPTLFYMPHCPMRLYSNVLWANWENLENIIIFGNSFVSYQEKASTGAPAIRSLFDPSSSSSSLNCMAKVLPYVTEIFTPVFLNSKDRKKKRKIMNENLWNLENAFNDSAYIYLSSNVKKSDLPNRPDEYFGSVDDESHPSMRQDETIKSNTSQ